MVLRIIIILFITLFALGSALWLDKMIDKRIAKHPYNRSQSLPDYYMKEFTIQGTDVTGRPKFQLSAKLMNHYPYDDHSDLIKPKLKFYSKQGPPWYVQSETGRISSEGKMIHLFGLVHIQRKQSKDFRPVSIITRNITFRPDSNIVTTKESVNYTSGVNQIYGVGMKANLSDGRIKFLSNTKGRYEPNNQ